MKLMKKKIPARLIYRARESDPSDASPSSLSNYVDISPYPIRPAHDFNADPAEDTWHFNVTGGVEIKPLIASAASDATVLVHDLVGPLEVDPTEQIVNRIRAHLKEDSDDAVLHNEPPPTPQAVQACEQLGSSMGWWLLGSTSVKFVASSDGCGGASLVVRDEATERRADLDIDASGRIRRVVIIDVDYHLTEQVVTPDRETFLRKLARWVIASA